MEELLVRDTWLGSGINSYDRATRLECPACEHDFEEDLWVDDYKVIDTEVRCPECDEVFNYFEEVGAWEE
mgnify:CR=1 FL=1